MIIHLIPFLSVCIESEACWHYSRADVPNRVSWQESLARIIWASLHW